VNVARCLDGSDGQSKHFDGVYNLAGGGRSVYIMVCMMLH
jgi:hypothetical protein